MSRGLGGLTTLPPRTTDNACFIPLYVRAGPLTPEETVEPSLGAHAVAVVSGDRGFTVVLIGGAVTVGLATGLLGWGLPERPRERP